MKTTSKNKKTILAKLMIFVFLVHLFSLGNIYGNQDSHLQNSKQIYDQDGIKIQQIVSNYDSGEKNPCSNTRGTFDVELTVEGDSTLQTVDKKLDVVLVVDASESMTGTKLNNANEALIQFSEKMLKNKNVQVGVVYYGNDVMLFQQLTNNIEDIKRNILHLAGGGTHMQAGIREAHSFLKNPDHKKVIILISDGEPTYAYKSLSESITIGNGSSIEKILKDNTLQEADKIKSEGVNIYSVGIGVNPSGEEFLKNVSSNNKLSDAADDGSDLSKLLEELREEISISKINQGSIVIPMDKYVEYLGDGSDVKILKNAQPYSKAKITWDVDAKTITIQNIDLGKNEILKIQYPVKLKAEYMDAIAHPIQANISLQPFENAPLIVFDSNIYGAKVKDLKTIDIVVNKSWTATPKEIKEIEIIVYKTFDKNTSELADRMIITNNNDVWQGIMKGLPMYEDGKAIVYTVKEVASDKYKVQAMTSEDQCGKKIFNITNQIVEKKDSDEILIPFVPPVNEDILSPSPSKPSKPEEPKQPNNPNKAEETLKDAQVPQGNTPEKAPKVPEEIVPEPSIPKGTITLPKTSGLETGMISFLGLGLVSVGLLLRRKQ